MKTKIIVIAMIAVFLGSFALASIPKRAEASCCICILTVSKTEATEWPEIISKAFLEINRRLLLQHQRWVTNDLWVDNVGDALLHMAGQLSAVSLQQTQIIGSFFDATHQMETQQVLQAINARAHKDYHPSIGMCEFGSNALSLASSERKGEINAQVMGKRTQNRMLGSANTAAAFGKGGDMRARMDQFRTKFCDPADHNGGLRHLCQHAPQNPIIEANEGVGATIEDRKNRDIDYTRLVYFPWSLNVDFSDTVLTHNEEEVLALSAHLYNRDVLNRVSGIESQAGVDVTTAQSRYMDARALLAKSSVAEHSLNALVSMKSEGAPGAKQFLASTLRELGVRAPGEAERMMGDNVLDTARRFVEPSYYTQMEMLTKKLYQNPSFYTNLYDKPENVRRKGVAMQAIGLMQKFDLFKSHLRNEANLSILLELAVQDMQDSIENQINQQKFGGEPPP